MRPSKRHHSVVVDLSHDFVGLSASVARMNVSRLVIACYHGKTPCTGSNRGHVQYKPISSVCLDATNPGVGFRAYRTFC